VAGLIRERIPVTVYHDPMVLRALARQGVDETQAREYAHSACHNVVVAGHDAGTGVGGFHNIPALLLLAMNGGCDPVTGKQVGTATPRAADLHDLDAVLGALTEQVRFRLKAVRQQQESQWVRDRQEAMPLLQSALMRHSVDARRSCWHSAPVSHHNHYFMGLGTAVDSLSAIRELVYERKKLSLPEFLDVLVEDWEGHDALRAFVRTQTPRFGQDHHDPRALAARLGRMWVREVEHASRGMTRNAMWPAFYSHMTHAHSGSATPATPDGRRKGDALSENVSPSYGTTGCTPTSILRAMSVLPFDHTPSGAASLTLSNSDVAGAAGAERIVDLLDTYFHMGGLHMQMNVVDAGELEDALVHPDRHRDLVVRVTGFSAHFTDLTRTVQEDLVRRFGRDTSRSI
jgi:formate C-acetyltransferase